MKSTLFWKKFVILAICLIVLDYCIGKALSYLYFTQDSGKFYNITVALEEQNCDALIFGSSRALHHYNPAIISDSLNMSCYNVGYDAQSILYCKGVLDVILERYIPKMIILDINPGEFSESATAYDNLSVLNPYVKRHPVLWNTLLLKSKTEKIKHLSSIYPYNSIILDMIAREMTGGGSEESGNGFAPLYGVWDVPVQKETWVTSPLDSNKTNAFDSFCLKCLENNIEIYVAISPVYKNIEGESSTIQYLNGKCSRLNIPLFNYINDEKFFRNDYYSDFDHLNLTGADFFSADISNKINELKNK